MSNHAPRTVLKLRPPQRSPPSTYLHQVRPPLPQGLLPRCSAKYSISTVSSPRFARRSQIKPLNHCFSTSSRPRYPAKTIEQARSSQRSGPFSLSALILFFAAGGGLIWYFQKEKARMDRKRVADQAKGVGKPKVGGPFELVDQEGNEFGDGDMKGGFSIVYFGFTHCPDICPDELDKLAKIIDLVNARSTDSISASRFLPSGPATSRQPLLPIFISCDPARDTPAVLQAYLKEFHPGIVGLTGTWEQIKDVCKKYRVYFSTPQGVKAGEDYLVDHSIYFYVMDPEGDFVEAIGRQHSPETAARIISEHMGDWDGGRKKV